MIKLEIEDNKFKITASPLERELVMQINGLRSKGTSTWYAPIRWALYVDIASTIAKYGGDVSPEAQKWGAAEADRVKALIESKDSDPVTGVKLGDVTLLPHQFPDSQWLQEYDNGNALLTSDMRTGKSFTLLKTVEALDAWPVVIVCPPGVTFEWDINLSLAFPTRSRVVLSNGMSATQRKKALETNPDFVVLGYNLLSKHSKILSYGGLSKKQRDKENKAGLYDDKELQALAPKVIIADEAHNAKTPTSQITRALWALGDAAEHRFAATGTITSKAEPDADPSPTAVDISDLWPLLRFVYPLDFPAKSKFLNKYLNMQQNFFGILECKGLNRENKVYWDMVFSPMFLRRLRNINTVKDYREIPVELPAKQRKVYAQLEKNGLAVVGDQLVSADGTLPERAMKVQAALATLVVNDDGRIVGMQEPSAVLDALLEWIGSGNEKTIVFSDSALFFRLIEDKLNELEMQFVSFPGGLTDTEKKAVTAAFRDNPDVRLILCSLRAANAGIDLSAGTRIGFASMTDDAIIMQQAEDRNLGPTQTAPVSEVAFFYALDTVHEEVFANIIAKLRNSKKLYNEQ